MEALGGIKQISVAISGDEKPAWMQIAPSTVSFKTQLPYARCRLKAALGMNPAAWDKPGDGALCKILIDDILLENLFSEVGSIRITHIREFFRPRTFFFKKPRTYFMQFIDPQHSAAARSWQDVSLDLSAFAGRVVNITFEVSGGPRHDNQNDEVLWASPVIESY